MKSTTSSSSSMEPSLATRRTRRSAGSLSSTSTRGSTDDLSFVGGTTLTASSAASEIEECADAEKENVDPSIQHSGVGDDGAGVRSTTDGADADVPKKRPWNGCLPSQKRKKKGIGMPSQKNSKTYIAYKEAMAAAPPPPIINNERESDVADGNDSDDDEDSTPTVSPLALLPYSKLLDKSISMQNTINHEREMRKRVEEKLSKAQEKLKEVTMEARRDKKASLDLIDEARREGVEMMESAEATIKESQHALAEMEVQMEARYTEQLREEQQYWNEEFYTLYDKHESEYNQLEELYLQSQENHEKEERRMTVDFAKQLAQKEAQIVKEKSRAEFAEAELERMRIILRDNEVLQRQGGQHLLDENAELREMNSELTRLRKEAENKVKAITKAKQAVGNKLNRINSIAERRKEKFDALQLQYNELKDELADVSHDLHELEKERMQTATKCQHHIELKRGRATGKRGGSEKWSFALRLLIWEQLSNGTAPSAIPRNIQSSVSIMYRTPMLELPHVNFVREQRLPMQVANILLSAYKLGKAKWWNQIFTDSTSRRQTSFQCLIIEVEYEDGSTEPITVSSCFFAENETSEVVMEAIIDQIERLSYWYGKWIDRVERDYPEQLDHLPKVESIGMHKFAENSAIMTDNCNGARKLARLTAEKISIATGKTTHTMRCHHHLRNTHVKAVLIETTKVVREITKESLAKFDKDSRVSPDFMSMVRAFDKEFSLCANYPKGHGALFLQWMKQNHPIELFMHVERAATGKRHDIVAMASLAIFWNRQYCVEFLHDLLFFSEKSENILSWSLWATLSSLEMAAVARLWSIFHIAIILPERFISSKVHEFAEYEWTPLSIGRVYDKLKDDLEAIVEKPELIHKEKFMMGMMKPWVDELPPLKKYLHYVFEEKKTDFVHSPKDTNTTAVSMKLIRAELFNPIDLDNQKCTGRLEQLAKAGAQAWIRELLDPKKATFYLMSVSGSEYCWPNCTPEMKEAFKGKRAVNDLAESSFATVTQQLTQFGRINIANAAGVSDVQRNKFLKRSSTRKEIKEGTTGLLHTLPLELQYAMIDVCTDFSEEMRKEMNCALDRQLEHKRIADEIRKEKGMAKVRNEFIRCLMYHRLYFNSDSCWKTKREVRKGLKKIDTQGGKLDALKMNIQMRYLGLGWTECKTKWTLNGKAKSVKQLKARLLEIIRITSNNEVPVRLYPKKFGLAAKMDTLPVLGDCTEAVKFLCENSGTCSKELDSQARVEWKEREENCVDGMQLMLQEPGNRRTLDASFIGKRIQYLASFGDDDEVDENGDVIGKEMYWCIGTVEEIYEDDEEALVLWDAIPKYDYPETRTVEAFPANKFKRKCVGGWMEYKEVDYGID